MLMMIGSQSRRMGTVYTYNLDYRYMQQQSDVRLKKDITPVDDAWKKLSKVQGITFHWKALPISDTVQGASNLTGKLNYGFSAQNVKEVFPDLVSQDSSPDAYLSVNYMGFIPLLTEAVKSHQSTIDSSRKAINKLRDKNDKQETAIEKLKNENNKLKKKLGDLDDRVDQLEQQVNTCCQANSGRGKLKSGTETAAANGETNTATTGAITGDDASTAASLNQNAPNPFGSETTIGMYLPATVQRATLRVYDLTGKQLKAITVNGRGNTSVTINGRELPAGMYHYVLVADGQLVGTREMILTE